MAHRLVKSSMTSCDSMTSHLWCYTRHNLQSRRIRKLWPGSTICVDPLITLSSQWTPSWWPV